MLNLSLPPLSIGVTIARLALFGKTELRILLFIAVVRGLSKNCFDNLTSLAGILSSPVATCVFSSPKSLEISNSDTSLKLKLI